MRGQIGSWNRAWWLPAAALAAPLWATPLAAQEPGDGPAQRPVQQEHVVRRGDTLWDLAGFYLSNPFLWPDIFEVNRDVVENPHLIYPEERLRIPPLVRRAEEAPVAVVVAPETGVQRTRFYSGPSRAPARVASSQAPTVLSDEEPPSPVVSSGEFYAAPWLDAPDALPIVGRLVQVLAPGPIQTAVREQFVHPYDNVFLSYQGPRPSVGDRLLLVRIGREVKGWGRIIEPTGVVTVSVLDDDLMTAVVTEQFDIAQPGDIALPLEPAPTATDAPQVIEGGPEGVVVAFLSEQLLYATTDIAFVDLGRAEGLRPGDELIAFLPERPTDDGSGLRSPAEPVARLKVVRVQDESATVRVLRVAHGVLTPGIPVRLVRRMP